MFRLKKWRLIESGVSSAAWNMAVDEALLQHFQSDDLPILRLYGWEPSLSIGRFSPLFESVDLEKTTQGKVSLVRRMSGGGVLVHDKDLSYTLILPHKLIKEQGVKESYAYLCQFLIHLYKKLGHDANFAQNSQEKGPKSTICLANNEPYDILIKGQKMGGNAQRHTTKAMIQHGTIPLCINVSRFKPLFLKASGLEEAATLEKLGNMMDYESLSNMAREAFSETFDLTLISDSLHHSEEQSAQELLDQKYSQERWNLHGKYENV